MVPICYNMISTYDVPTPSERLVRLICAVGTVYLIILIHHNTTSPPPTAAAHATAARRRSEKADMHRTGEAIRQAAGAVDWRLAVGRRRGLGACPNSVLMLERESPGKHCLIRPPVCIVVTFT